MSVFKEFYEVVGAAKKRAQRFATERQKATDAQWKFVKAVGAKGYRPGPRGYIRSLFFVEGAQRPDGLRKVGIDMGCNEFEPRLNVKAGKELRAKMLAVPPVIGWDEFADSFDWHGRSPMEPRGSQTMICHCSGVRVSKPRERIFLQYPRELNDGWKAPKGLVLVRESDMLRAVENHNALIKPKRATGGKC